MRNQLNNQVSGSGVIHAFYEYEDTYRDYKVGKVRFPHDKDVRSRYEELCSPVIYSRIEDLNIGAN